MPEIWGNSTYTDGSADTYTETVEKLLLFDEEVALDESVALIGLEVAVGNENWDFNWSEKVEKLRRGADYGELPDEQRQYLEEIHLRIMSYTHTRELVEPSKALDTLCKLEKPENFLHKIEQRASAVLFALDQDSAKVARECRDTRCYFAALTIIEGLGAVSVLLGLQYLGLHIRRDDVSAWRTRIQEIALAAPLGDESDNYLLGLVFLFANKGLDALEHHDRNGIRLLRGKSEETANRATV